MRVFLTRETKKNNLRLPVHTNRDILAILAFGITVLATLVSPSVAQDAEKTGEITSNEIWYLQGGGDTLWMGTALGVNFTNDAYRAVNDDFSWNGYYIDAVRDSAIQAFQRGDGEALISLYTIEDNLKNTLMKIGPDGAGSFVLGYQTEKFREEDPEKRPSFIARDMAYTGKGRFWLACGDGGLVAHARENTIFFPGRDTVSYNFSAIGEDFTGFRDARFRVVSVDGDISGPRLIVACERALWEFNQLDTLWTLLTDTTETASKAEYIDVKTLDSTAFFVTAQTDGDTSLYKYTRSDEGIWSSRLFIDHTPTAMAFTRDSTVYIVHDNRLNLYADLGPNDTTGARSIPFKDNRDFGTLRLDLDMLDPMITDIVYTTYGDTTALWIATSEGLILSASEEFAADSLPDFEYIRREKPIQSGLEEVYAVPSIINENPRNNQAVFAYNLGKNDHVTIDVYDWNMDHVVRVISNQFRKAGVGSGRSTVRAEDNWDGMLPGGNPAAPGVYYFKISTEKNGRAFGKLIVAKTR